MPRLLWKLLEGNKLSTVVMDLKNCAMMPPEIIELKKKMIAEFFDQYLNFQKKYSYCFICCELFNFINVTSQILFMQYFLNNQFLSYGLEILMLTFQNKYELRQQKLNEMFPKMSKCIFHKFGSSGSVQTFDALCILPLNNLFEKIYLVLWFWFFLLFVVTLLAVIFRIIFCTSFRFRTYWLATNCQLSSAETIKKIVYNCHSSDIFFINQMSKNIDTLVFKEIIDQLSVDLYEKREITQRKYSKKNEEPYDAENDV